MSTYEENLFEYDEYDDEPSREQTVEAITLWETQAPSFRDNELGEFIQENNHQEGENETAEREKIEETASKQEWPNEIYPRLLSQEEIDDPNWELGKMLESEGEEVAEVPYSYYGIDSMRYLTQEEIDDPYWDLMCVPIIQPIVG